MKVAVFLLGFVSYGLLASYGAYLLWFIGAPSGLWVLWAVNLTVNVLLMYIKDQLKGGE